MESEKKYYVKENLRFNLESMRTHVQVCMYDIEDGKYKEVELMGETMNYSRLNKFLEEIEDLMTKANYSKVTGKEYGRIKAISDERNMLRYIKCINSGMSENDASYAFFE